MCVRQKKNHEYTTPRVGSFLWCLSVPEGTGTPNAAFALLWGHLRCICGGLGVMGFAFGGFEGSGFEGRGTKTHSDMREPSRAQQSPPEPNESL